MNSAGESVGYYKQFPAGLGKMKNILIHFLTVRKQFIFSEKNNHY